MERCAAARPRRRQSTRAVVVRRWRPRSAPWEAAGADAQGRRRMRRRAAAAIDPVGGGGDDCATTKTDASPGAAVYSLPAATGAGYTLLGAPTMLAKLSISGTANAAQIAGRLWDVAPDGSSQTLVARGTF